MRAAHPLEDRVLRRLGPAVAVEVGPCSVSGTGQLPRGQPLHTPSWGQRVAGPGRTWTQRVCQGQAWAFPAAEVPMSERAVRTDAGRRPHRMLAVGIREDLEVLPGLPV